MRIVLRADSNEQELIVDPGVATSAELAALVGRDAGQALFLDGQLLSGRATLADAGGLEGSTVTLTPDDPVTEPFHHAGTAVIELHQIAGIGAGGFLQLPPGRYYLGPTGPTVGSVRAAMVDNTRFRLAVAKGSSCALTAAGGAELLIDGTALEGTIKITDQYVEVDGAVFRVTPAMDRRRPPAEPGTGGRLSFVRPARLQPSTASRRPVPIPAKWAKPRCVSNDSRRRERETADVVQHAAHHAAIGWRHALDEARAAQPDIAELRARARVVAPTLWERRPGHPDQLTVAVGFGTGRWRPTTLGGDLPPELAEVLQTARELPVVPLAVQLGPSPVEIVGPRSAVAALARWLVIQVAVHHGPDDVNFELHATAAHATDWLWAGWLPHVAGAHGATPRRATRQPLVLHVDDSADADDANTCRILIATSRPPLPVHGEVVVNVSGEGSVELSHSEVGRQEKGVMTGITIGVAAAIARDLAPLSPVDVSDPEWRARLRR